MVFDMTKTHQGRRWVSAVAVALAAVGAVAGCSGGHEAKKPGVASLATAAPSGAGAVSGEGTAPRERLDMTTEEIDRLNAPYRKCRAEHGSPIRTAAPQPPPGSRAVPVLPPSQADIDKENKAAEACKSLETLGPWEYDPKNPDFRDNAHKLVQCMKSKGVTDVKESTGDRA